MRDKLTPLGLSIGACEALQRLSLTCAARQLYQPLRTSLYRLRSAIVQRTVFESLILLLLRFQCACGASLHGPMAAPSAQARHMLQDAFERFASTVTPDDQRLFRDTQLKDVRDEAMRIERQLRARRTQRNTTRLDPFLRGMEHYSKVVEVLCNGTPFLPWIWAPVKLMLMVSRTICQRPCRSL